MAHNNSTRRSAESAKDSAERLVRALGCSAGSSLDQIKARVEHAYGRPLVLQPVGHDELRTISGLWLETDSAGYVFFRAADPLVYRVHSIFHEFGHILANHQGCEALSVVDDKAIPSVGLGQQIRRARARGALQDDAEVLAEEVAYALSRLVLSGSSVSLRAVFE